MAAHSFSTKERRPFLQEESFRLEMFRMLAHHIKDLGCLSLSVGGYVDHVHLLAGLSRTMTIAKLVEQVKAKTSQWAKTNERMPMFSWQTGYGAFSVSHSNRQDVDNYIRQQGEHHTQMSFQDELRKLCKRHEVALDERYAWD